MQYWDDQKSPEISPLLQPMPSFFCTLPVCASSTLLTSETMVLYGSFFRDK